MFSHKANPMYDTTQTMTTTSSGTNRGDDFEVIRVPPGQPASQEYTTASQEYPADPMAYLPPQYTVSATCAVSMRMHDAKFGRLHGKRLHEQRGCLSCHNLLCIAGSLIVDFSFVSQEPWRLCALHVYLVELGVCHSSALQGVCIAC